MVGTMGDEIMPVLLFATLIYWTQQAEREREREKCNGEDTAKCQI